MGFWFLFLYPIGLGSVSDMEKFILNSLASEIQNIVDVLKSKYINTSNRKTNVVCRACLCQQNQSYISLYKDVYLV